MTTETVLRNARIVLSDDVIEGSIVIRDGAIAGIDTGASQVGEDMEGDLILPGLIELHTDHLENHYSPRPGVRWPVMSAIHAHDAQIATSGITTVFDCLRMGSDEDDGFKVGEMRFLADAIHAAEDQGRLRAEHFIHLRCEVSASDVMDSFAEFEGDGRVKLASLMDHAPGQRQFQSMEQYTLYYKTKRGLTDAEFEKFCAGRIANSQQNSARHRKLISDYCNANGIALASHDDATIDHVAEAIEQGVRVAEFPTTIDAARASHDAGMKVLMGGPNIVRGGSHSGNIAASELAALGILDVISSDYVPFSMLQSVFALSEGVHEIRLPDAVAKVTSNPADAVGLADRGRIAPGFRADLIRIRKFDDVPQVRSVWRQGLRVA
ncbi:alpha-D-ribose 1-methylphosphonate 5-triphosphate diphosphatase [Pelagibacterium lentulum]|uniref:Phosphonate metabolism protein PhnM n=1 Tax=Pelagibacterium lentulum TaxID=2029865 RepID=A0A916R949_9HYPH|nr:alpha-D-ribose 1-methylphosphonate 5-triphosphate diphosphatase [Pelagibacterium lentulum]GGA38983.1 phosphonate metabolism protein PhnM [Pelagibacterium lentulum]